MNAKLVHRVTLILLLGLAFPAAAFAGYFDVGIRVGFAPPDIPVYAQPPCPAPGYIWTPGYWAYSDEDADYYWVPGTWVLAPVGALWTPGYWALDADADDYLWHPGFWGPHVGFYGGINYGFGYFGVGFAGGYWRDHDFYYNRAVTNISNVNITNVYNHTVINNSFYGSRPSYNGGDGVSARPTRNELLAAREPHRGFTRPQRGQVESARTMPARSASVPPIGRPSWNGTHAAPVRTEVGSSRTTNPVSGAWQGGSHEPAAHVSQPSIYRAGPDRGQVPHSYPQAPHSYPQVPQVFAQPARSYEPPRVSTAGHWNQEYAPPRPSYPQPAAPRQAFSAPPPRPAARQGFEQAPRGPAPNTNPAPPRSARPASVHEGRRT